MLPGAHPLSRPSSGLMGESGEGSGEATSPCDSSSTGFEVPYGRVSGVLDVESPHSAAPGCLVDYSVNGGFCSATALHKQACAYNAFYAAQQQQQAEYYASILQLQHPQQTASYAPYMVSRLESLDIGRRLVLA